MNKQQLANKIWESANNMRSKIEANEYKDYILGFIFYKYLSDTQVKFLKESGYTLDTLTSVTEEDVEELVHVQNNLGYFISYPYLFSTWIAIGRDFNISHVRDGLSAFGRLIHPSYKKVFDKIFQTLETGLSKLGDTDAAQGKAVRDLLELIKDIPMDGKQDYDVLGFIYEYLISQFAANAGKKAGEFYTPHEVSVLMSEIVAQHLSGKDKIKIYDPTSGSGSLLINIGKSVAKHMQSENNIKYYAQELKENTYNLTRMNLIMRGITPANIVTRRGDTLKEDWPYFDDNDPSGSYDPLYVDAVVSNPPYSLKWDPAGKENDPRYARFGLAPKTKADYAFLLHDLYHIRPDGIMTIVLPHGVLFRGGEEGNIRKNLIESNHIDAIIGLPANIFFGTSIPTIVMVLKQKREKSDVLIIDASKGFVKEGKNNKLRACDIKKIVDTVAQRSDVEKYSRCVPKEEIQANDYNLNIPRYVDSSPEAETYDIYATMYGGIPQKELDALPAYWAAFPQLRNELFSVDESSPCAQLRVEHVSECIAQQSEIQAFQKQYSKAFADFYDELHEQLITRLMDIQIEQEKDNISKNIFSRLEDIPLIDKYNAYQILSETWQDIAIDLDIIQSEGFNAIRTVDPRMVEKNVNGKKLEIQNGYEGRILHFSLIQSWLLGEELSASHTLQTDYSKISTDIESIAESVIEELTADELPDETSPEDDKRGFAKSLCAGKTDYAEIAAKYSKEVKQLKKLFKQESLIKKDIKIANVQLLELTKERLESLTDEQCRRALGQKWIIPLRARLSALPTQVITNLSNKLQDLSKKYAVTFRDTKAEITQYEQELCRMIDDLTGDEFDMKGLEELKHLLGGA